MPAQPKRSQNKQQSKPAAASSNKTTSANPASRPLGAEPVGAPGMFLTGAWLIALSIVLVIGIVQLWLPAETPTDPECPLLRPDFLLWQIEISQEARLIVIVALTGALGTQIRTVRSFAWYVGNRKFTQSWLPFYFLTPVVGATLALVFYFVIRAGFFSADSTSSHLSVYGFAGMAGLVGIFSDQAILRLKEVAEVVFKKPPTGADNAPQD